MNEHKNIITIEDEIKEFSDKPVKSSALFKKIKELEESGGGGMPADYPYETATLFEGNVEYADGNGDIEGAEVPEGMPIKITINGTTTDLVYIEEESLWSDTESADDSTIQFGNGSGGSPAWLWMNDAPGGTYAVKIESNAINENFENAVKEIISETEGILILTPPSHEIIHIDNDMVRLCPKSVITAAFDRETGTFSKAIFINVPVVENGISEWQEMAGLFALTHLALTLATFRNTSVSLETDDTDVYLVYTVKQGDTQ